MQSCYPLSFWTWGLEKTLLVNDEARRNFTGYELFFIDNNRLERRCYLGKKKKNISMLSYFRVSHVDIISKKNTKKVRYFYFFMLRWKKSCSSQLNLEIYSLFYNKYVTNYMVKWYLYLYLFLLLTWVSGLTCAYLD
jgi:hypothetical protein